MDDPPRSAISSVSWMLGAREAIREALTALDTAGASAPRLELDHDGVPLVVSLGPTMSRIEVATEGGEPTLELRVPTPWLVD